MAAISAVQDVRSGKKSAKEAAKDVAIDASKGALEGGIKGAASGAAQAGARVVAEKVTGQVAKRVLGGAAPAVAAITAVEMAKHAIDLARGMKTVAEFRQAAKSSAANGAACYLGAEIGMLIGGPVGALVGGIAAPMIADKSQEMGLGARLDRFFTANTANGHHGGTIEHLRQLQLLLDGLRESSATVFPDRLLRTPDGHQASVELVVAHGRRIYLVEFRAWKGTLAYGHRMESRVVKTKFLWWEDSHQELVDTGELDKTTLLQLKEDQYGISHQKAHRNPLRGINTFAYHLKQKLSNGDARWGKMQLQRLTVFPDDSVTLTGDLAMDKKFMMLSDFLDLLNDESAGVTPLWQLDGLSSVPTWDSLQDQNGNLYQGLIETETFSLNLEDGRLDIPFSAIIKAEVSNRGSGFSRHDGVRVMLRTGQLIEGFVEKQPILLNRKGHRTEYLLRDLQLVCPAYQLLSEE